MMSRLTDLSPRMRQVLVVVVGMALVALAFLTSWPGGDKPTDKTKQTSAGTVVAQQPVNLPGAAPSGVPTSPLMPLTAGDMGTAVDVATRFTTLYTSFRYDQDQQAWINSMQPLLSSDTQVDLKALLIKGAAAQQAVTEKRVTTSTAQVTEAAAVMKSSVLFHVTATTKTTAAAGSPTSSSAVFDVVVTNGKTGWGVTDIRLTGTSAGGQD